MTLDPPFLMSVMKASPVRQGCIVAGQILRGSIHVQDVVSLVGIVNTETATVLRVGPSDTLQSLHFRDATDVLLQNVTDEIAFPGRVLAAPDSIEAARRIRVHATHLTTYRDRPFFTGYRSQFEMYNWIRVSTFVACHVTVLNPDSTMWPGQSGELEIELIAPVAMESGMPFRLFEGDRIIVEGTILELLGKPTAH